LIGSLRTGGVLAPWGGEAQGRPGRQPVPGPDLG